MQTRTYGDLYKLIQSLAGVKSFAPSEQDDIANFINRRFFTAYSTTNAWPRYLVNSEKRIVNTFKLTGVNATGPGVAVVNNHYYFLGNDANGNPTYYASNPDNSNDFIWRFRTDTKKWALTGVDRNTVSIDETTGEVSYTISPIGDMILQTDTTVRSYPWQVLKWEFPGSRQTGYPTLELGNVITAVDQHFYSNYETRNVYFGGRTKRQEIGEFIRIYQQAPNFRNSVKEYDFFQGEDGAQVINPDSAYAFVTYKLPFTQFSVTSDYETSVVEVPEEFFSYLAHGAYADFLTMDGQTSKAIVESDRAEEHLRLQLEKVDIMNNNNFPNTKFSTYVNRQAR
jgi:hypothetical protein